MNTQLSMLGDEPVLLLHDAEGGIVYWPQVVPPALHRAWFDELRRSIDWHGQQRWMYERSVTVPRLMARVLLDDPARPRLLDAAVSAVCGVAPAPYTHAGFNLYRDGRDSVAPHNDRIADLAPGQPIAILSLGDAREMLIRAKAPPHRPVRVLLEPGSVLVMSHASQYTHDHGIPKTAQAVGPRISVALRVRYRRTADAANDHADDDVRLA